jgi:beta-aspartyl-peptidase (threonine type)
MREQGARCTRCVLTVVAALLLVGHALAVAAEAVESRLLATGPGYEYYATGDVGSATPGPVTGGFALMGGGNWPLDAFRWFVGRAGGGHLVVLRARGGGDLADEIFRDVGGLMSIETLVIHGIDAAEDPTLLAVLAHADGIFVGGGDQSNYVRLWKGTAINRLLDAHVAAGRPIGGTSAGLAILGGYVYGCLDSISLVSADALANPTGPSVTLVRDFLHLPYLSHVITDTHFAARDRLGRLVVFVSRLAQEERDPSIVGLGIDQDAALTVDTSGIGRFYGPSNTYAWLVRPRHLPATIVAGRPLSTGRFEIVGIGAGSTLDFRDLVVAAPAFRTDGEVRHGTLVLGARR